MAAVRGRKRTEDPTPNRARDIQRAFRARRAAHLESLEDRIHELEEENNYFRALLQMPPANRPALGKGPTGRGLAKSRSRITVDNINASATSSPTPPSNSPTTPTMECPIPLPPPQTDPFAQMPVMDSDGTATVHVTNAFHFPQEKAMDHNVVDQFAYNGMINSSAALNDGLVDLPADFESVSIGQGLHATDPAMNGHGIFPEYAWATQVPPNMGEHDIQQQQQTPVGRQGVFSFTQQSMAPRAVGPHVRPAHATHRRSLTEPQSLGSLIAAGFTPGHRPASSEAFTSTPSPPPLPIRAPFTPQHVYQ